MSEPSREKLLKEFRVYDTAVDIVSSWEAAMKYSYDGKFDQFYFDRFPELPTNGDNLTPDFCVFFNQDYGIIGEIKRTFPDDRKAILSELEQIERYDAELGLRNSSGEYVTPATCDIVIIIEGSAAPQIGTRLQRILTEEKELSLSKNPVLLRYQFNQDALMSRYEFQRVTDLEFEFRDDALDLEKPLSILLGEEGDYNTLEVYPEHFYPFKVQKPICNDTPPGVYLATFLWHKIFPDYLNQEQYEVWQATDGQKEIPLEVTVEDLTENVNNYMNNGTVKQIWIQRALEFLRGANLAEEEGDGYKVRFMGFVQNLGEDKIQENIQQLQQIRELGHIFIRRYCEKAEPEEIVIEEDGDDDEDDTSSSEQAGLGDFM